MSKADRLFPVNDFRSFDWKIQHAQVPNTEARMAIAFVERWAMVAAEPDGEDSSGRQKLRRMTPDEIVNHACQTATLLWAQFERFGWLTDIPSPEEAKKAWLEQNPEKLPNSR